MREREVQAVLLGAGRLVGHYLKWARERYLDLGDEALREIVVDEVQAELQNLAKLYDLCGDDQLSGEVCQDFLEARLDARLGKFGLAAHVWN